jgi:hypothetical protein
MFGFAANQSTEMPTPRYYFHGTPTDYVNRVTGNATATFDANAPAGSSDISQTGAINGNPYRVANPQSVYWLSTNCTGQSMALSVSTRIGCGGRFHCQATNVDLTSVLSLASSWESGN